MPHSNYSVSHPIPETFTADIRESVLNGTADPSVEGAYIQALEQVAEAAKHCWGNPTSRQHADVLYNALSAVDWMVNE